MHKTLFLLLVCISIFCFTFASSVYAEELICDLATDPTCDPTTEPTGWCDPTCDPATTCDPVCVPDDRLTIQSTDLVGDCTTQRPLTFDPISRETILKNARVMANFSWSPPYTIDNWAVGTAWYTFEAGALYRGEAYTQANPQRDWTDFYCAVNSLTSGGGKQLGNDCSGFVSLSWQLPKRFGTDAFRCDAENRTVSCGEGQYQPGDDFVHELGPIGSVGTGNLLPGDAVLTTGHIMLFKSYMYDNGIAIGINVIHQTPPLATEEGQYTWDKLVDYRPIRRNKISDYNYVFQKSWGSPGTGDGQFTKIGGIATDTVGNVYVSDSERNRIQKFDNNGVFLTKWPAQSYGAYGMAVDSLRNVYVADYAYNRIQQFDKNGQYLTQLGVGYLSGPYDLTIDKGGTLYVADFGSQQIQRVNTSGTYLGAVSEFYGLPLAVDVDSRYNLYVATDYNIEKFDNNGHLLSTLISDPNLTPYGGITTDFQDNVYVPDSSVNKIYIFDSGGFHIATINSSSAAIASDTAGNLFIADRDRVSKYSLKRLLPKAPSDLIAIATSATVQLVWKANSANETRYDVYRKTGPSSNYAYLKSVYPPQTTASDVMTDGADYYYAVAARNAYGVSAYSKEARVVSLKLLSPNGGEIMPSGSIYNITWSGSDNYNYTLKYSLDDGKTWNLIQSGLKGSSYNWQVPKPVANSKQCRIKIIAYNSAGTQLLSDTSTQTFTIEVIRTTSPTPGQLFKSGTVYRTTWTTNATKRPVASINLLYTKDGGTTWVAVKKLTGNPGSYDWVVPSVTAVKSSCRFKVVLLDSGGVSVGSDPSDGYFTIQP